MTLLFSFAAGRQARLPLPLRKSPRLASTRLALALFLRVFSPQTAVMWAEYRRISFRGEVAKKQGEPGLTARRSVRRFGFLACPHPGRSSWLSSAYRRRGAWGFLVSGVCPGAAGRAPSGCPVCAPRTPRPGPVSSRLLWSHPCRCLRLRPRPRKAQNPEGVASPRRQSPEVQ